MILYVGFAQHDEWVDWANVYARHALRFEEASGHGCLTAPYWLADAGFVERLRPDAVVLSGFARSFEDYPDGAFGGVCEWLSRDDAPPVLAICGAHQLVGYLFNRAPIDTGTVSDQPMRLRRPGEPITNPDYHPEYFMERGFYELHLLGDDPLFDGCGRPPVVMESHYCEIKQAPPGFRVLASTADCALQAMRHQGRPLISVQFHPEDYTERFPDGRRILSNWFAEVLGQPRP